MITELWAGLALIVLSVVCNALLLRHYHQRYFLPALKLTMHQLYSGNPREPAEMGVLSRTSNPPAPPVVAGRKRLEDIPVEQIYDKLQSQY